MKKTFAVSLSLLSLLLLLFFSRIPIPLDFLNSSLESFATHLLDRRVVLHGPVRLRPSLKPILEFGGLTIGNPMDWPDKGHLLTVEKGRGQVSLIPLLRGNFRINDLTFEGVDLQLVTRSDHTTNYRFSKSIPGSESKQSSHALTGMDHISLHDIHISYLDELSGRTYSLDIDEAHGSGAPESPLYFSLHGDVSEQPVSLEFKGGSLAELLEGKKPWPLTEGKLSLANTKLDLHGTLVRNDYETGAYLAISLGGTNLETIGAAVGLSLPDIGDFSMQANIGLHPGMARFSKIEVTALNNSLDGDLLLFFHDPKPTLAGNITIPTLHPTLFSAFTGKQAESVSVKKQKSNDPVALPWQMLEFLDTDLHLHIASFQSNTFHADNIQTVVSLVDGDLLMPFAGTIMDIPANGQLKIMGSEPTPSVKLDLSSRGTALAPLFAALGKQQDYGGELGDISLTARTSGSSLEALIKELDLDLQLGDSKFLVQSDQVFSARKLSLQRRPNNPFILSAAGDLLGRPFQITARAGRSENAGDFHAFPLHLQLEACDTDLLFDGALYSGREDNTLGDFHFSLNGEKICGFLSPVETFIRKNSDFSVQGKGMLHKDGWLLELETLRLNNLIVDARAEQKLDPQNKPLLTVSVHSSEMDLSSILQPVKKNLQDEGGTSETIKDEEEKAAEMQQKIAQIGTMLTKKILPQKHLLATDALLNLHVERLKTGRGSVSDIKLSTVVEDGKITRSPFQVTVADELFTGNAEVDFTQAIPTIHLELASEDFNLPELLQEFQISPAPDITAKHIEIDLKFKGSTIKDLLLQSSNELTIRSGKWLVNRPFQEPLRIAIKQAKYTSSPGTSARISLSGSVNSAPLIIEMTEDGLFGKNSNKSLTLDMHVNLAEAELSIEGRLHRKKEKANRFDLSTILKGGRLDNLNEILGVNLPPLGPYLVKGVLSMEKNTFILHDIAVEVGDSILTGEMVLSERKDDSGKVISPRNLKTRLSAESIQLDDFRFGDWSPLTTEKEETSGESTEENQKKSGKTLNNLFSPELASMVEGTLTVDVKEVLSGTDKLGSGHLMASLADGLYSMENLHLDLPGGTVQIQGGIRPDSTGTEAHLSMQIEHLDYGILIRRAVPESDLKGKLNVSLDVRSEANNPLLLKEHLNGILRFAVVPEEFKSGVIDLWAVNIITAALPALMKGGTSELNCLAGDFVLEDGIMHPKIFLLDTSGLRVQGKGEINFKTNTINFHMKPTPKSAHFFSLATPISVTGPVTDFRIGVTAGGVLGTMFGLATSVVTVPFQWLFTDNMEPSGDKACSAAMEWVKSSGKE
ncbi:MAG: AsmA-like C-terminal region-containing protein [Thermodesulfobacteriota bacterium]|nr:AsmA-like C-terminal region-containing protein [Thermodesulfobacteriota bacterium]